MIRWLPLAVSIAAAIAARQPPAPFRSGIEIVELDVSVTRGGLPVQGLTARDFVLTDNGVAQTVDSVMLDRVPLSVTLLLDTSTSVLGERLAHLKQAGNGIVDALTADDRASLITFSHDVNVAAGMTADKAALRRALAAIRPGGSTALRDALQLALSLRTRDRSRPVVLIFTDGDDTTSWITEEAILDTARRCGIVIHAIRSQSNRFLERLTEMAGGRTWSATSDRQLRELFTSALDEMRARYLLTYAPRGVAQPGWHEVKVRVKTGRADIIARPGYFVAAAAPSGSSPPR
jgi:Ca-activated chloride channel homolog